MFYTLTTNGHENGQQSMAAESYSYQGPDTDYRAVRPLGPSRGRCGAKSGTAPKAFPRCGTNCE